MPPRRSSSSRKPKKVEAASNGPLIGGICAAAAAVVVLVVFVAFQMGRSSTPAVPVAANTAPAVTPAGQPAATHQQTAAPQVAHASLPTTSANPANPNPPNVPHRFVYSPNYSITERPADASQRFVFPATAFAVRHPDFKTPIVLSCLHVFPPEFNGQDMGALVQRVTLNDKFSGVKVGEVAGGMIPIPEAVRHGESPAGDVVAMWGPTLPGLSTVNLATKRPEPGEPVWVVSRILDSPDRKQLHRAKMETSSATQLRYEFENSMLNMKETEGSPVLNAAGEVVGIHLGDGGSGRGKANPVEAFLPYLVAACKTTPVPDLVPVVNQHPGLQTTAGLRPTAELKRDLTGTELVEFVEPSVVVIRVNGQYGDSLGSGFVVDKEGTIVTNYHVIEGAKSAVAMFRTKEEFPIKGWWALDPDSDLAVLKIDCPPAKLFPVKLATELPKKGEAVAAFGAPQGLDFSYTKGDVSALRGGEDFKKKGQYIQTSAAISSGNSGGPLTNMRGEVVGVNSFKLATGENLNFAVSSLDVTTVLGKKTHILGSISPKDIPDRSGGRVKAEDLSGTERGNVLLGRIREAMVIIEGVTYDPTGRLETFVLRNCESAIDKQLKWKRLSRREDPSASTAFMVILVYFDFDETKRDLVTEIHILMQVIARDVDENRRPVVALVYKEDVQVGTVSINALVNGIIPRTLETSVPKAFNKLSSTYKKANREAEGKALSSSSDKKSDTEKKADAEKKADKPK